MADFNFNPPEGLNNTSVFVDEPTTGAAARQQFMTLFNQLKDYVNVLNNQSYPANGGNADTLDGQHSNAFASSGHLHDDRYTQFNHKHYWGDISDLPNNLVKNNIPRITWTGVIPANGEHVITHNLNSDNILLTVTTSVGNVNPLVHEENVNQIRISNYNSYNNSCAFIIKIW